MKNIKNSIRTYPVDLLETKWSQDEIYGRQLFNTDSLIGCVPVAFGQILKYHEFPPKGKGVIKKHPSIPEDVDIDGFDYPYELMPNELNDESTSPEIYYTGSLLAHLAYAFKTQVASGGGAPTYDDNITDPLIKHFSYDKNIKRVKMSDARMSISKFKKILKSELFRKRPVSVMIPGHAIVCTGYDDNDDTFSFNYGWGKYTSVTHLENIEPTALFYNIKPCIKESLQLKKIDYNGQMDLYAGDTGVVLVEIENISELAYDGIMKLVLCDEFNYSQDVLFQSQEIEILAGDTYCKEFTFTIPEDPSLGKLSIAVEYFGTDGESRYLSDKNNDFASISVNIRRAISRKVQFHDIPNIPDSITIEQPETVTLSLEVIEPISGKIYANLVDSDDNVINTIGFENISFPAAGIYSIDMELLIGKLKTQVVYKLSFMLDEAQENKTFTKLLSDNEGCAIYHEFKLLNNELSYHEGVYLIKNIDISAGFQYLGSYDFIVEYEIADQTGFTPHYIRIDIVDKDRNILYFGQSSLSTSWHIGEHKANLSILTRDHILKEDLPVSINVSFVNLIDGYKSLLSPVEIDVNNPTNTIVQYRRLIDYISLIKSVNASKKTITHGDELGVNIGVNLNVPYAEAAFICDYSVYFEDGSGNLSLVHRFRNAIANNIVTDYTINFLIPTNLPTGVYKVYVSIDFNAFYEYEDAVQDTILKSQDMEVLNYDIVEVV